MFRQKRRLFQALVCNFGLSNRIFCPFFLIIYETLFYSACNCYPGRSLNEWCDRDGRCICVGKWDGKQCTKCKKGYNLIKQGNVEVCQGLYKKMLITLHLSPLSLSFSQPRLRMYHQTLSLIFSRNTNSWNLLFIYTEIATQPCSSNSTIATKMLSCGLNDINCKNAGDTSAAATSMYTGTARQFIYSLQSTFLSISILMAVYRWTMYLLQATSDAIASLWGSVIAEFLTTKFSFNEKWRRVYQRQYTLVCL